MTAYRVVCWYPNIKREDRNSRNMSDGAIFSHEDDAIAFASRIVKQGGAISSIKTIENATHWFDSLEEYDRAGSMTADELHAIGQRGR